MKAMVQCNWPTCSRKVQQLYPGPGNYCGPHRRLSTGALIALTKLEGPASLNLPTPTNEELEEFIRTGEIPSSRRIIPSFENKVMQCACCGGPLIIVNLPDGRHMGICRKCSFESQSAA
jgi:hypothetical protein